MERKEKKPRTDTRQRGYEHEEEAERSKGADSEGRKHWCKIGRGTCMWMNKMGRGTGMWETMGQSTKNIANHNRMQGSDIKRKEDHNARSALSERRV
jgi:hypothetical protein